MPTLRSQPRLARPRALVVSDSPLRRLRHERRLRRAGLDAPRAVDPARAEAQMRDGDWDVVLWDAVMHADMARELVRRQPPGRETPVVLVVAPDTPAAQVAAALAGGIADVVRDGADHVETAARTAAQARRRARERARLEEIRRIHALADGSRDLLARHSPDGVVLYASGAAREILGVDPADLAGRRAGDLAHPDDRDPAERAFRGDVEGAGDDGLLAHRMRRRDGTWAWMETSVRSVRDASGRIREIHTDSRDVSDRVRADADRDALARITAAVAGGAGLDEVAGLVARQAAVVAGCEGGAVVRRHGDEGIVVGAAGPVLRAGDVMSLPVESPATARAAVVVEGAPWGLVAARGRHGPPRPGEDVAARLRPLADLMSLAVANARTHERLVALATTDPLTSLANRRSFRERLEAECARSARAGIPLGLALVDLDHFKRVNDTHGHQAGDAVLRELARRLRRCARREDIVARIGGEEFAWLLPEADLDAAMEAAERLRRRIAGEPFAIVGRITASIGVATLQAGPDELVRDADRALYRAKDGGRDLCVAWTATDRLTEARSG